MIETIENILSSQGYGRVKTNIDFVTLYTKYEGGHARAVQVFDCVNKMNINDEQFNVYDVKAEEYLKSKGYKDVALINIVVTSFMPEIIRMISKLNRCWVINSKECRLRIYENQPNEFEGLNSIITLRLLSISPPEGAEKIKGASLLDSAEFITEMANDLDDVFRVHKPLLQNETPSVNFKDEARKNSLLGRRGKSNSSVYIGNSQITLVNSIIVALNVFAFFWLCKNGLDLNAKYLVERGAMYAPLIKRGEYFRLFTCMFMHASGNHLVGNMVMLLALGDNVERAVGWVKYLLIYIGGGLMGSFVSYLYAAAFNPLIPSVGASGAIFAIIGALLWLVASNGGKLEEFTTNKIVLLILYSLYSGFTSKNVDNAAHIGGLFGGFIIAALLSMLKNRKE